MKTYKISCDNCNAVTINGKPCHESGCYGTFTYRYRGKEYKKATVWNLDVWGNKRDGFEVNDRYESGSVIIPANLSNKEIIKALKKNNFLVKRCHTRSFSIDGDDTLIIIDAAKTGEPIYQLEVQ